MLLRNLLACALLALLALPAAAAQGSPVAGAAEKHGWQPAIQMYTFRQGTFLEGLEKVKALGLRNIEIYSTQKFSADDPFATGHTMTADQRQAVLDAARAAGVRIVSYGVITGKSPEEWEAIFAFAREMGLEFVNTETPADKFEAVDELARRHDLRVAIHNHATPTRYWQPETVLEVVTRSAEPGRWGACADTGHWVRSGLNPVASLALLEGHISTLHFKDLSLTAREGHDVPWGTGVNNVWAMLGELKRQGWRGYIIAEYEHANENLVPNIAQSLEFLHLASAAMDNEGWEPLLAEDLSNAVTGDNWAWQQGELTHQGRRADLWTRDRFGDFILDLEFKCADNTNSGVFLRTGDTQDWLHTAIEVQILQPEAANPTHNAGGIFDVKAPTERRLRPVGEWNHATIIARANNIHMMLNGAQVLHINLDEWTEAGKNPDGTPNKFRAAYRDMPREGHIGLQDHGQPVSFRNLRIKRLD